MRDKLFILLQYLLPHHGLSRLVGGLAECRIHWLKNLLIRLFIHHYRVNMHEARHETADGYASFNDFFTRPLKPEARLQNRDPRALISPCDGTISQIGPITQGRIVQAKGQTYSLIELLGGDTEQASALMGGSFATIYLSPKDYHRVHMPAGGTLRRMTHVPGRLFSVNQTTTEQVPNLFARNERVVCAFDTDQGPITLVLVGAMIVASVETVWAGEVAPLRNRIRHLDYPPATEPATVHLAQGDEMGRFKLGSTVIVLTGRDVEWQKHLDVLSPIRQGEHMGAFVTPEQE